ncbi:hypothetical protein C6W20_12770 [Bacillus sp. NMCN6]|nr:hypothetical protein C6W21_13135 [Bacillus sp. NMCN1]PRR98429.1 hypothetical protein C6W20_12770 [Bacillus sp. NMCN6]
MIKEVLARNMAGASFLLKARHTEDFLKIKSGRRVNGNFGVKYKIGHEPIRIDNSDEVRPIEI